MKKFIALTVVLAFASASAFGMCGRKVTTTGTLKSNDAGSKTITVTTSSGSTEITLTPNTEYKDAAGKVAKIDDLVGKNVTVVAEHNKADSVVEVKKG